MYTRGIKWLARLDVVDEYAQVADNKLGDAALVSTGCSACLD
jgi:hypothetical protein